MMLSWTASETGRCFFIVIILRWDRSRAGATLVAHSLVACGSLVLCCTAGPGPKPGWEEPAPFCRIWCLFEIFQCFKHELNIEMQLAPDDERGFKMALQKDGLERIETVLSHINVLQAQASFEKDRVAILRAIEKQMSFDEFNDRVRSGLRREYRRVSASGLAASASSSMLMSQMPSSISLSSPVMGGASSRAL